MNRLLAAVLLLVALPVFSQNQVRFEHISVEDGLSQSAIKSMVQDEFGYLWIGTLDGLNKYDGNQFYVFQNNPDNPTSIPRNDIHKLFIDDNQNLWVSTVNYLSRFVADKNSFINYRFVSNPTKSGIVVNDMHQESDSVLMLSTNKGIWKFNLTTGKFSRNKTYAAFDLLEIRNYTVTKDGTSWIATMDRIYTSKGGNPFVLKLKSSRRLAYYHSKPTAEVFVQTVDSLYLYDFNDNRFVSFFTFPKGTAVADQHQAILKLKNGDLWVIRNEVFVFDSTLQLSKTLHYIPQDPFSLSSDYLSCLFATKDGVVWVGTNGMGLNKYSPQLSVFNYFGSFPGAPLSLSNNFIASIVTENDNELFIATTDGFDVLNLAEGKSARFDIQSKDGIKARINNLALSPSGELWMATSRGLRKWKGKEVQYSNIPQFDNPDILVNDLLFISRDELMVANSIGIFIYNIRTQQIKRVAYTGTLSMMFINKMLWAERYERILEYDTGAHPFVVLNDFKNNPADQNSFPDAVVKTFFQDREGKIWIGTSGKGLVLFDKLNDTFTSFTEKDGLPNNVVYGILEDNDNNLWLSTNKGIAVFNKAQLRCIRVFNKTHGLQGDEFNTNAYFRSPSGMMYFGGVNGLTVFDPAAALAIVSEIPKCIITGLFVNGARHEQTGNQQTIGQILENNSMVLSWSERNFGFEISSLGFSYPAHTSYQYFLDGYEKTWTFIENERRVQFTNIPPGNYVFRVKASNSFGEWEPYGVALAIRIKPPLWRAPWFIGLVLGVLIALIYAIFRWRTKSLRNQTLLLEQLVSERTRTLQIQQEEIAAQNEELTSQSEMMDQRNIELERVKHSLEERVVERTTVLQQLNEELIDQNTKLEQFAFITAHNIRGPVARIQGLINLLHTGDEEVVRLLDTSAKDLDEVISDLSKVLSIRKGIGNLSERVELKSQLQFVIKTLTDEIKNVGAMVDIDAFSEVHIDGLRPYIYSVFYNLIHNALKYSSHERAVVIKCSNKVVDNKVIIDIEDNGIGIDMRYAGDKIFNLYQRFHTEVAGKGFGLFLARTQVESMGGSIQVESIQNKFTRFTIQFPMSKADG